MTPKHLRIEIRDQRLRGGRLSISARTTSGPVARKREAVLRTLMERGETDIIELVRQNEIHIADVERAVRDGDIDRLRRPTHAALTLGALLDRVVDTVEATRAEGTAKQYRVLARQLKAALDADTDLTSIGRDQAREFLYKVRNGGRWSARKQAQAVALAGRIWREAIEAEAEFAERTKTRPRLTRNPWREIETSEVRPTRVVFLRPAEWRVLADRVQGTPQAAALALGCLAGLRLRETIHLRVGVDVELADRRLHVQPRDGAYPWRPKTWRGTRTLRIGDELHRTLLEHIDKGFAGGRYLIRTPRQDRPVHPSTLALWTQTAFEAAGIVYGRTGDGLTYHSLRHTFASWLVQRDVQLKKVAMLLGDTAAMVERVYGHLLPTDLDRAVDLLDSIAREGS